MRILVTNDDGVRAPGIAALSAVVAATGNDCVVVAPMVDYSGAGAAVGPVHSRDGVDYEAHQMQDLDVPAYGVDGPPALAVILACSGAFGPRPDALVSGINHGANVGRSALHSGTVGAALTGAHFGLASLAVSIRFGADPVPWETPATLARALLGVLGDLPPATVLNLNVPDVALDALKGVRRGRLGTTGTIRSAVHEGGPDTAPAFPDGTPGHLRLPPTPAGTLRLDLTPPWEDATDLETDAGLLKADYASLTPLVGVRDAGSDGAEAVGLALAALAAVPEG